MLDLYMYIDLKNHEILNNMMAGMKRLKRRKINGTRRINPKNKKR